jgi:RNA polymerase sigma factor (sigma-70 family)
MRSDAESPRPDPPPVDDEDIWTLLISSDEAEWQKGATQLADKYAAMLVRVARRRASDDCPEAIANDALWRLIRRARSGKPKPNVLGAYLVTVAKHGWLNAVRRATRRIEREMRARAEALSEWDIWKSNQVAADRMELLDALMETVTPGDRDRYLWLASEHESKSWQEIAAQEGTTADAIRQEFSRFGRRLRNVLGRLLREEKA